MRRRVGFDALLIALCSAGCAVSPTSDLTAFGAASGANSFEVFDRGVRVENTLVLPVEHDPQIARPSCGAHALASVVNYWNGSGAVTGEAIYRDHPPEAAAGYSMAELLTLARTHDLLASAVRLEEADVLHEIESGRPVLAPVRLPSIYVQRRTLPGADAPVIGAAKNILIYRAGRVSEWTGLSMVDHYLLLVGYEADTFVVVEPLMGYRTISADRLARYREPFGDAAIVFSGAGAGASGRGEATG
jgi:hypothetical protein